MTDLLFTFSSFIELLFVDLETLKFFLCVFSRKYATQESMRYMYNVGHEILNSRTQKSLQKLSHLIFVILYTDKMSDKVPFKPRVDLNILLFQLTVHQPISS